MKPKRKKPRLLDPDTLPAEFQRMLDTSPECCMDTVRIAEELFAEEKDGMTPETIRKSRALLRELRSEMSSKAAFIMVCRTIKELSHLGPDAFRQADGRLVIRKALVTFRSVEKLLRHVPKAERIGALAVIEMIRVTCRGVLHAIQSGRPFNVLSDIPLEGSVPRRSRKQPRPSRRERPAP